MRRYVGLWVFWIAAVALVLVGALIPDVDDFSWGQSGTSAWGRIVGAATLVGILLGMVWDRLVLTLIGWSALAIAVWVGYAFNAGAWLVAALGTVALLVLLLIAGTQVMALPAEELAQRQAEKTRRAEPTSLEGLRTMRADVQAAIDEHRAGRGTGDLELLENVRDRIDKDIRERELDERLRGQ